MVQRLPRACGNSESEPNKLLDAHGEQLDIKAAGTSVTGDQTVATLPRSLAAKYYGTGVPGRLEPSSPGNVLVSPDAALRTIRDLQRALHEQFGSASSRAAWTTPSISFLPVSGELRAASDTRQWGAQAFPRTQP